MDVLEHTNKSPVYNPSVVLQRESPVPLHFQLYKAIIGAITQDQPPAGARLPSEGKLAASLSVDRSTVRRAYQQLVKDHLLESRPSRYGVFITEQAERQLLRPYPSVGIILPYCFSEFISDPYQRRLHYLKGMIDRATELDMSTIMLTPPVAYAGREVVADWASHTLNRLAGLIHLGDRGTINDPTILQILEEKSIPQVSIAGHTDHAYVASVSGDAFVGLTAAVEYLWELGHRRLAVLTYQPDPTGRYFHYDTHRRGQITLDCLRRRGLAVDAELVYKITEDPRIIDEAVAALLERPNRPTALFCHNDLIATFACESLSRRGIQVPRDMSVVGFEGLSLPGQPLTLTTIRQPFYAVGSQAVDYVKNAYTSRAFPRGGRATLPTSLVIGQSTGPVPGNSRSAVASLRGQALDSDLIRGDDQTPAPGPGNS